MEGSDLGGEVLPGGHRTVHRHGLDDPERCHDCNRKEKDYAAPHAQHGRATCAKSNPLKGYVASALIESLRLAHDRTWMLRQAHISLSTAGQTDTLTSPR